MRLRDLILRLMPQTWREEAIRSSQEWRTTCGHCGHQSTIWDLGGLRWKAAGNRSTGAWCPSCGTIRKTRMERN